MKKLLILLLSAFIANSGDAQVVLKQKIKFKLADHELVRTVAFSTNS